MAPSPLPSSAADAAVFNFCLLLLTYSSLPTFLACQFIQAPYGRHLRSGWGPTIPSWLSWLLMESPTIIFSLLIYPFGQYASSLRSFSLLAVFLLHYFHRTVVYPLRLRRKTTSDFPISISLMAFSFNLLNSYVQSRWVSNYCDYDMDNWFWGAVLRWNGGFGFGMVVNVKSDLVLVGLKAQGGGYKIPRGGLFEWVSCPNYLGEIIEWLGWAIMTWSWAGFGFFLYTFCNLVPRAMGNHKWYLEKFKEDYPKNRKAIIPFLY